MHVAIGKPHAPISAKVWVRHRAPRITYRERNGNSSESESRVQQSGDRRSAVDHGRDHKGPSAPDFWEARCTQSHGRGGEGASVGVAL